MVAHELATTPGLKLAPFTTLVITGSAGGVAGTNRVTGIVIGERSGAFGVSTMLPWKVPTPGIIRMEAVISAGVVPEVWNVVSQFPPEVVDADTVNSRGTVPKV